MSHPLSPAHRERLLTSGVPHKVLKRTELREVTDGLPDWWRERGNALYVRAGRAAAAPRLRDLAHHEVSDSLVVLASSTASATVTRLHGDRATLFIGPRCHLPACEIHCHADSTIVLAAHVTCTHRGQVDARNGGRVVALQDQLWASDVYIATDDMHRLEDAATGARLNGFGGRIELGRHVWLGREAAITGNVTVGENSVVGMRASVRNREFEAGVVIAGAPARVVRTGVNWTRADTP